LTEPFPPRHLKKATAEWVAIVREAYELEPHHDRLLLAAAETWDRLQQAREALAENGLIYHDTAGIPHKRPEVEIEKDSRIAFARLLRELDLDVDGAKGDASRPPALRSNRRLKSIS
jgi:phage terminase small subunit